MHARVVVNACGPFTDSFAQNEPGCGNVGHRAAVFRCATKLTGRLASRSMASRTTLIAVLAPLSRQSFRCYLWPGQTNLIRMRNDCKRCMGRKPACCCHRLPVITNLHTGVFDIYSCAVNLVITRRLCTQFNSSWRV